MQVGVSVVSGSCNIDCSFVHAYLQVFAWEGDQKNVVTLPKRSCENVESGVQVAGPMDSPATVSLNWTGTFFFSSSSSDDCAAGSLFAVAVTPKNESAGESATAHHDVIHSRRSIGCPAWLVHMCF